MNPRVCPICGHSGLRDDSPHFPFCSPRCRGIDFGRWIGERYRIPIKGHAMADPTDGTDLDYPEGTE